VNSNTSWLATQMLITDRRKCSALIGGVVFAASIQRAYLCFLRAVQKRIYLVVYRNTAPIRFAALSRLGFSTTSAAACTLRRGTDDPNHHFSDGNNSYCGPGDQLIHPR
jgi:multisubunit Na+/H+ antiporter MnhB subunit